MFRLYYIIRVRDVCHVLLNIKKYFPLCRMFFKIYRKCIRVEEKIFRKNCGQKKKFYFNRIMYLYFLWYNLLQIFVDSFILSLRLPFEGSEKYLFHRRFILDRKCRSYSPRSLVLFINALFTSNSFQDNLRPILSTSTRHGTPCCWPLHSGFRLSSNYLW